jgi:hypothetical protein
MTRDDDSATARHDPSGELHPLVRRRLTEVVQLLQVFARLAEIEIASGERPRAGDVISPSLGLKVRQEWAGGEGAKVRETEELAGEHSAAMQAHGSDPTPIRAIIGL